MNKKIAKYASKMTLCLSIVCVAILELSECRPLGAANKAERINNIMLTLSYSFMGAYLFYLLNDWLPMRFRMRIAKAYVKREMRKLGELLRLCMSAFNPFSIPPITSLSKEEFVRMAVKKDLKDKTIGGSRETLEQLEIYKGEIIEICERLLSSYYNVMNDKQTEFVNEMLNSYFVANIIVLIDYNVPDEYIDSYPNNQQEVCESIYDSYQKVKRLIAEEESHKKNLFAHVH